VFCPLQASQRRSLLPLEVCARHKVSQEQLFRWGPAGREGGARLLVQRRCCACCACAAPFCPGAPPNPLSPRQTPLRRGPPAGEGLRDAVLELGSAARGHLSEARRLAPRLPPGAAALLAPGTLAGGYLEALQAAGFDPFDPRLPGGGLSPLRRTLLVRWHAWRGTF
jgi:phytoene/squalene synthetase